MKTRMKTLAGVGIIAVAGGVATAGLSYADHRGQDGFDESGPAFLLLGELELSDVDTFGSIDADGNGILTQAEIDKIRNDAHAANDGDGDGNLTLEEFSEMWQEIMHPITVRAFQSLDTDGDAVITRAEFDQPLANIVERLDRNGDGGLSMDDRWRDQDGDGDRDRDEDRDDD